MCVCVCERERERERRELLAALHKPKGPQQTNIEKEEEEETTTITTTNYKNINMAWDHHARIGWNH